MECVTTLSQMVKDMLLRPSQIPNDHAARVSDAVDDATQCLWGVAAIHDVHLSGHQARLLTICAINAFTARMEEFQRGER